MATSREAFDASVMAWRSFVLQQNTSADVQRLEPVLRDHYDELVACGLAADEASLIAFKRIGDIDIASRGFVAACCTQQWPSSSAASKNGIAGSGTDLRRVLALAVAAGATIKLPDLLGLFHFEEAPGFFLKNAPIFVLPWLAVCLYLARHSGRAYLWSTAGVFVAAACVVNAYPFQWPGHTVVLTIIHLPIALWWFIGRLHAADRWHSDEGRMDFIRFSGELCIFYVLIALGGWVTIALTFTLFTAIGINPQFLIQHWLVPCGAAGAFIIAAWLAESRRVAVAAVAPVLTHVFTPLFALLLLAFLVTMLVTGQGIDIERQELIAFDVMLVLVLALLLYSMSARDGQAQPNLFDLLQLVLICSALLADLLALGAIAGRINEFGFSPNRVAALGENILLLVNLAWAARLYVAFYRRRQPLQVLAHWQTRYLLVWSGWAAFVVLVFPPVFGFR
ncbi:MAG: hypothetical protein H6978_02910 [Gammaproteobacteria bacterium]|nr:hypothetical protein [Gammaproteobacteria bacterium]